jgi:hypothetical protein
MAKPMTGWDPVSALSEFADGDTNSAKAWRNRKGTVMIVGHLRRYSPQMTHDHENNGESAMANRDITGLTG